MPLRLALPAAVALLFALFPPFSASGAAEFVFPPAFHPLDAGPSPRSVATGDVNEDGRLDLVVLNEHANPGVSVLLADSEGGFESRREIPGATTSASALVLEDLNGDRRLDLAIASRIPPSVVVLLGNGDGTFDSPVSFDAGDTPNSIATGDFDGNGSPDLAVTNRLANTVSILLGDGNGSFGARHAFPTGARPQAVAIGDLDGSGSLDLVTANRDGEGVTVLLGVGNGGFMYGLDTGIGGEAVAVAVDDLNADGRMDLAVARSFDTVVVLLGLGNGRFLSPREFQTAIDPRAVAIRDLNQDGRLDLALPCRGSDVVSILLGDGTGGFGAASIYATGQHPSELSIADLNEDGRLDLAVSNEVSRTVAVLMGNGDGSFGLRNDFPTGDRPSAVAVGDVNRDGRNDVVVANAGSNTVSVLLGDGGGGLTPAAEHATGVAPSALALADFDGDRLLDLAVTNEGSASVSVRLGRGDGGFGPEARYETGALPISVIAEDLDGGGHVDLVVANEVGSVSVLLGLGDGRFGLRADHETGIEPNAVAAGDLNGDGRLDLVASHWFSPLLKPRSLGMSNGYGNGFSVLIATGEGDFLSRIEIPIDLTPRSVRIADLNRDGALDLVAANGGLPNPLVLEFGNTALVLLGNGDGTFAEPEEFETGEFPFALEVADVTGDGALDLVVSNRRENTVSVLRGNGEGGFSTDPEIGVGSVPVSVALGDLNGDALPDLVTANRGSNTVSVLLNQLDPPARPVAVRRVSCGPPARPGIPAALNLAILGSDRLDVAELDPATIRLEGISPSRFGPAERDVGSPAAGDEDPCACPAGRRDGHPDRVLRFELNRVLAVAEASAGDRRMLTLTGQLLDGTPIEGTVCFRQWEGSTGVRPVAKVVPPIEYDGAGTARPWSWYPNPFTSSDRGLYLYAVPERGARVSISIYAPSGRRLVELVEGHRPAGLHAVNWDGRDRAGMRLAPGVYFLEATVGTSSHRSRIVLLR